MRLRVVIAEDHRILREALVSSLSSWSDLEVVGEAEDGAQAVRLVRQLVPDVLITDLSMPGLNGIDAIARLRAEGSPVGVICLSVHTEDQLVLQALRAGANAYLPKACSLADLRRAIDGVVRGEVVLSPSLVGVVVSAVRVPPPPAGRGGAGSLTTREREVLQLLAEGHSTQAVAQRLHLSEKTVGSHRQHIQQKLGMRTAAELTRHALRMGLTSLE